MLDRPQLGVGIFARGQEAGAEVFENNVVTHWTMSLLDLLQAYGAIEQRKKSQEYDLPVFHLMSSDKAMERLGRMLGALPREGLYSVWASLHSFLPDEANDKGQLYGRSVLASTFTAGLEMAKQGRLEFRQDRAFRPVYMRACDNTDFEVEKE